MIKEYPIFFQEILFEKIINESIVYYSPNFLNILQKISDKGNKIAKELINYQGQDSKQDITFIDIDKKDGYLSFITMKNAVKLIEPIYPHIVNGDNSFNVKYNKLIADGLWEAEKSDRPTGVYSKSRNQIKVGKIVNKLLPGKFNDEQIEEFVNIFKSVVDNAQKFVIVEGDDIAEWYKQEKYKEMKGTLGKSCMRSMSSSTFDIYTKNPEVCKLVLLLEDDMLLGRALLWKLNTVSGNEIKTSSGPKYFLDRQYTINDSDVIKFRDYAVKQGWGYKTNNNHHSFDGVTFNGNNYKLDMTVQLKKCENGGYDYKIYPYLDTFRRYDPINGVLYNDDERDGNEGHYILESTSGGYEEIKSGVWSEWEGEYIPEDEVVWSDNVDSYLRIDSAVEVDRGSRINRGWWPSDHENIVYDSWLGEHLHINDCVWSDHHNTYIYVDDAISAVKNISHRGHVNSEPYYIHVEDVGNSDNDPAIYISYVEDMIWYKILSNPDKYFGDSDWEIHNAIMRYLLIKNYDGKWIPKEFSMNVYKSIDKDEYYSIIDAYALGIKINTENYIVIDKFEYEDEIKEKLPIIKNNLLNISKDLKVKIYKQTRLEFEDDEEYIKKIKTNLNDALDRLEEINCEYYI